MEVDLNTTKIVHLRTSNMKKQSSIFISVTVELMFVKPTSTLELY